MRRALRVLLPAALLAAGLVSAPAPASAAYDPPCWFSSHPRPVVLVHGTFENGTDNWMYAAPALRASGYCVFTLEYGRPGSPIGGTEAVKSGAAQLAAFVDEVLARTGAAEVDLVGHSQGGMMPRWYIDHLGGAAKVHTLVGLAPSNHGTTANGLLALRHHVPGGEEGTAPGCQACLDQEAGSPFMQELAQSPETNAGVSYTVIQTKYDQVVTPYTSAFLSGATNILLQDVCPTHPTDHVGISYDPAAIRILLNALDPARAQRVIC